MAVVDVPDIEGGAVTGQTAGAQGGHTPLVGELRQRVGLIHELAQGGGAEELLDGCLLYTSPQRSQILPL